MAVRTPGLGLGDRAAAQEAQEMHRYLVGFLEHDHVSGSLDPPKRGRGQSFRQTGAALRRNQSVILATDDQRGKIDLVQSTAYGEAGAGLEICVENGWLSLQHAFLCEPNHFLVSGRAEGRAHDPLDRSGEVSAIGAQVQDALIDP